MRRTFVFQIGALAMLLGANAPAQAGGHGKVRVDQRIAGTGVFSATDFTTESIFEGKGAPGRSSLRLFQQFGPLGPPSARCDGFEFELPVLGGSGAATFADFSQAYGVITSGYICGNADGTRLSVLEFLVTGGSGRFEGASGTLTGETVGVAVAPVGSGVSAFTGSLEGELALP